MGEAVAVERKEVGRIARVGAVDHAERHVFGAHQVVADGVCQALAAHLRQQVVDNRCGVCQQTAVDLVHHVALQMAKFVAVGQVADRRRHALHGSSEQIIRAHLIVFRRLYQKIKSAFAHSLFIMGQHCLRNLQIRCRLLLCNAAFLAQKSDDSRKILIQSLDTPFEIVV